MNYHLLKCQVTGNERGNIFTPIAISSDISLLTRYCEECFGVKVKTLDSTGSPIPWGWEDFYIIQETKIIIIH